MDIQLIGSASPSGQLISNRPTPDAGTATASAPTAPTQTVDAVKASNSAPSTDDVEKVAKAVSEINKTIKSLSGDLEFSLEEHSNKVIVKVVDQQTKEVIRQIPSEEALEISKSLDKLQGLLIKQQA